MAGNFMLTSLTALSGGGTSPFQIVDTGTHLWITDPFPISNGLYKVDKSTLGVTTYNFNRPYGIGWDGTNILVEDSAFTVKKVDPSTGSVVNTPPFFNAYGSSSQKAACMAGGYFVFAAGAYMIRYNPATNTLTGTVHPQGRVMGACTTISSTRVWFVSSTGYIGLFNPTNNTFSLDTGISASTPEFIVYDGTYLWVIYAGSKLTKVRESDGAFINPTTGAVTDLNGASITIEAGAYGGCFDGECLNILITSSSSIRRIRVSDGVTVGYINGVGTVGRYGLFLPPYIYMTDFASKLARIKLADTTPVLGTAKADATGVQLIFDSAVNLSGSVDVGARVDSLQVTGGSQVTASEIHLAARAWGEPPPEPPTPGPIITDAIPRVGGAYAQ